jgi:hypothetical protein
MSNWIETREKLPEPHKRVLVYTTYTTNGVEYPSVTVGEFNGETTFLISLNTLKKVLAVYCSIKDVPYWAELPEAPEKV